MKRYYAASTNGFYRDDLHPSEKIPTDVVEISEVEFTELMDAQSTGTKVIGNDAGFPILLDPALPSTEELGTKARTQRDRLLTQYDWTQLPDAALSDEEKAAWIAYRQALRDITDQPLFPTTIDWPFAPDAL